jgi:DNA-binding MarR family transcriptional regulator
MDRSQQLDYVSGELVARAARLVRLMARGLDAEAGVLSTLASGARRVTDLAELEGLAQPTMTLLVKQLEERGLVRRGRDDDDGRVVLVHVTDAGVGALEGFRDDVRAALRSHLEEMSDDELAALATSADALQTLILALQGAGS